MMTKEKRTRFRCCMLCVGGRVGMMMNRGIGDQVTNKQHHHLCSGGLKKKKY